MRNEERILDWRTTHDLRNFSYSVKAAVPLSVDPITITPGRVLDQGGIGGCTGFGMMGACACLPGRHLSRSRTATNRHAMAAYELNTSRDPFQGDWPTADTGSSVLAAAKTAKDLSLIDSYSWASTVRDVADAIRYHGPVVIGIPWYNSMFEPAYDGKLKVDPSSGLAGGHCVFLFRAPESTGHLWGRNSWGSAWGVGGNFYVSRLDLDILFSDDGYEACIPAA
jgi:hypothetical protein